MKALVTGGTGFIGSHICDLLVSKGHDVTALDNLSTSSQSDIPYVDFVEGDIRDQKLILELTKDSDAIFHQAAIADIPTSIENPLLVNDVNINGTLSLLDAARVNDVPHVVFASSSSVYGNASSPLSEDDPLDPKTPYAVTKAMGEHYLRVYSELYGLHTVALRYFNVYGPRQKPGPAISSFIHNAINGKPITIFGDGEQTRDFIFVKDVARANLLSLNLTSPFTTLNVGSGSSVSIKSLAQTISSLSNIPIDFKEARLADARESRADISLITELTGWSPETLIEEGVAQTSSWARSLS